MPIKRHSNEHLEIIAEGFLKEKSAGYYDGLSLLIEPLIESVGYTIFPIKGLAEIAEAYIPVKRGYIFVDEDQYMNGGSFRWRFILAEELAHSLIHRPLFDGKTPEEIAAFQEAISDKEYLNIEQEAKYLAGALLMPRKKFAERFDHFYSIHSQRLTNNLRILKAVVRDLNLDFNVSYYSICVRSMHLKLVDWQQLDDLLSHYSR